ncbi:MAG TPA: hypothetical protein VJM32_02900 [Candidatus Saccharimonadales bacterium]|nr:hypothetical protein [Candidatus Saccharimonadales bacterium]
MPKYIAKLRYKLRDLVDYLRAFQKDEYSSFKVMEVEGDDYLVAAKKLHAKVYLDRGFIREQDIVDGIISPSADPHQMHSKYFVVIDTKASRMVATARQIELRQGRGHHSFAMVKKANLYKRGLKLIRKHDPAKSIEISGLAKERGVSKIAPLLLYRAMWHRSLREKHTLWLMASDVRLFIRLKLLFGKSITKVGRVTPYYGGNVVPSIMCVQESITDLKKSLDSTPWFERPLRHRIARFMLNGLPIDSLSAKERKALEQLVSTYKPFYSGISIKPSKDT